MNFGYREMGSEYQIALEYMCRDLPLPSSAVQLMGQVLMLRDEIQVQDCSAQIQGQDCSAQIQSQHCSAQIQGQDCSAQIQGQDCSALLRPSSP